MATFVLIHGAGSDSWYWHLLAPELRERGHEVVTMDLPVDDDSAGLAEYTDVVVEAVGERKDVVLVAQSLGGFTAPLVCERVPVALMILVTAMIPRPGEPPGEWWANTGHAEAKRKFAEQQGLSPAQADDPMELFFHDAPREIVEEGRRRGRDQSGTPFEKPWPLSAWPDVPTRFLLCRNDRFFPPDFMRRVVKDRLGITPDEIDGGHLVALTRPVQLADRLEVHVSEAGV